MKSKILALLAATVMAVPALAQDLPTIRNIDVTVDVAAVQNAEAAAYWGTLETDLEGAILARLTDRIADDGADLNIDISEVELANGFTEALNLADTRLVGSIKQTHDADNTRFETYDLLVDVPQSLPKLGEGFDIAASDADVKAVYTALIETYADNVVARIK